MNKKNGFFTIPNMLSMVRLCLIPLFMWLYCVRKDSLWTALVLVLSGLTDIADGYIARHFNMVSDVGKALDPIADKITQGAMLLALITQFPLMKIPFALLLVKEAIVGIGSLVVIHKTDEVHGAVWHGKITTALLYSTMILHLLWPWMPKVLSNGTIIACVIMLLVSLVLYTVRNVKAYQGEKIDNTQGGTYESYS